MLLAAPRVGDQNADGSRYAHDGHPLSFRMYSPTHSEVTVETFFFPIPFIFLMSFKIAS